MLNRRLLIANSGGHTRIQFNLMGKKSPTSIGGAMNCPIIFQKTK